MAKAFAERSSAAYEAEGENRNNDILLGLGLLIPECFIIDAEGVAAVGEAAGAEARAFRIADTSYLSGVPGEDETLNCSLGSTGEQLAVIAGTTLVDTKGQLERLQRESESSEEFDGSADGLDDADIAATKGEGVARLAWVSDGFVVSVTGPEDLLGGEKGFAALSAAVEGVERTLGAG